MTTPTRDELLKLAKKALEDSNELLRTIGGEGFEQSLTQIHDNLNVIDALLCAHQAQAEPVAPRFTCWSNDDGDSWLEHPADVECVDGLKVGDTYELLAGWTSVRATYRVTKAPDENDDDYEVECVSHPAENATPPSSDQTWNEALHHNFFTHRNAWRDAIAKCINNAPPKTIDGDDKSYWQHELTAFDQAFDSIARPSQAHDSIPFVATFLFDNETRVVEGRIDSSALGPSQAQDPSKPESDTDLHKGLWNEIMRYAESNAAPTPERLKDWAFQLRHIARAIQQTKRISALSRAQQAPAVSEERISEIFQRVFNESPGAARKATRPPEMVFRFARALLSESAAAPVSEQTTQEAGFFRGVIAALGALCPHSTHGDVIHDEIVQSVGKEALYAAAEPEDVEWAGLDPDFYAALQTKEQSQ